MKNKKHKTSAALAAIFAAGISQPNDADAQFMAAHSFPSQNPDAIATALDKQVEAFRKDMAGQFKVYTINPADYTEMSPQDVVTSLTEKFSDLPEIDVAAKNQSLHSEAQLPETIEEQIVPFFSQNIHSLGPKALPLPLKEATPEGQTSACIIVMPSPEVNHLTSMMGRNSSHLLQRAAPYEEWSAQIALAHEFGHCFGELNTMPEPIRDNNLHVWYSEIQGDAFATAYALQQGMDDDFIQMLSDVRVTTLARYEDTHFTTPAIDAVLQQPEGKYDQLSPVELYSQVRSDLLKGRTPEQYGDDLVATSDRLKLMNETFNRHPNEMQLSPDYEVLQSLGPELQEDTVTFIDSSNQAASRLLGFPPLDIKLPNSPSPAHVYQEEMQHAPLGQIQEALFAIRQEERAYIAEKSNDPFAGDTAHAFLMELDENDVSNQAILEVLERLRREKESEMPPSKQQEITPDRA